MKKEKIANDGFRDLKESIKSFHIIKILGSQDIRQRYKRSRLGPFWITISMAVLITTMGLVFGNLFKVDKKEFIPFLTLGLILWTFIMGSISEGCDALISSEGIIKQLPIPIHIHIFRVIWKNFIILLHNIVIFPFVLLAVGKSINFYILLATPGFILLILNLAWVSVIISMLCARFRDMTQIILSLMQVIFYITPIIWMPQLLTNKLGQDLLNINPLYHLLDVVRSPLLGQLPSLSSYIFSIIMAIIGFALSTIVMGKYKNRVPYWI